MHLVFVNVPSLQRELVCNSVFATGLTGEFTVIKGDLLQTLGLSSYTSNMVVIIMDTSKCYSTVRVYILK